MEPRLGTGTRLEELVQFKDIMKQMLTQVVRLKTADQMGTEEWEEIFFFPRTELGILKHIPALEELTFLKIAVEHGHSWEMVNALADLPGQPNWEALYRASWFHGGHSRWVVGLQVTRVGLESMPRVEKRFGKASFLGFFDSRVDLESI